MIEATLLNERAQLAAEARGFRRLVHDDAAAGLLDRGFDGLNVQRHQGAQVDDLGVHARVLGAGQSDPYHGAVGQDGHIRTFAHDASLADRQGVFFGRDLGQLLGLPRRNRLLVPAVEGAVVEALGLEEDDRIIVLDGGDQQALGVIGVGRNDNLQTRNVGEQGFWRLAVRLAAEDAAAIGAADRDRRGELTARAVAHLGRFRDDLVIGRINIVGELDLDDRAQAIGAHADGGGDDAALRNRGVEAAGQAVLLLQLVGDAEDAAEIARVLAEGQDVRVLGHLDVDGRVQGLNHVHRHDALGGRLRLRGVVLIDHVGLETVVAVGVGEGLLGHGQTPTSRRCSIRRQSSVA
ncbi:hypothetical protein D3C87_922550 [compost metagenome]